MKELMSHYYDLKKQVDAVKEQMSSVGEKFFAEKFKKIFSKYSNLEEVVWTAYTPYFNDGEPCTFSSNHEYAEVTFSEDRKENEKAEKEIEKFLSQFDDELMLALFGDEITIAIDKEGITIKECRHD